MAALIRPAAASVREWLRVSLWRWAYLARRFGTGLCRRGTRQRAQLAQLGKATGAALLAWWVAVGLLHSQAGWLAPMTAVLMVQATVYRSLAEGLRRVVAVGLGVVLSGAVGSVLGLGAAALACVVPASLVLSRWRRVGAQSEYIPVTAILLLTFGVSTDLSYLGTYLWETALGAAVGALVNAFVLPPTYLRDAHTAVADIRADTAALLSDVADGVRDGWDSSQAYAWQERVDDLQSQASQARDALRWGMEGHRVNPIERVRQGPPPGRPDIEAVNRYWHVAIDIANAVRAMTEAAERGERALIPDSAFRSGLSDLVDAAARLAGRPDVADEDWDAQRRQIGSLERRIAAADLATLPSLLLPSTLLSDVRRILTALREAEGV